MNIDKLIALCFFIGGLISNVIGFFVDLYLFDSTSWLSCINLISTAFGLFFLTILFAILARLKAYNIFNFIALTFFCLLLFPIILFTSPEGVFISYLSLLVPAIGLIHYSYKKYYFVGLAALGVYWLTFSIKVHLSINITSDFMRNNYLHFLGGITATYIFNLLVTTFSTLKLTFLLEKDPLTGVQNRHSFEKALETKEVTFGVMIDIDHFKQVNDTYGHKVGDIILKSLCDIVSLYTNENLIMYRYGGEEFFLISKQQEMDLMTTLKAIWIALNWQFTFKDQEFSVSMGVARNNANTREMVLEADRQLYKAKENGRHQAWFEDKRFLFS